MDTDPHHTNILFQLGKKSVKCHLLKDFELKILFNVNHNKNAIVLLLLCMFSFKFMKLNFTSKSEYTSLKICFEIVKFDLIICI